MGAAEESAEAEHRHLQAGLVSARKVLRDETNVCKKTQEALSKEQAGLEKVESILKSLLFISEYEIPEEPEDKTMEPSVEESQCKDVSNDKVADVASPMLQSVVEAF